MTAKPRSESAVIVMTVKPSACWVASFAVLLESLEVALRASVLYRTGQPRTAICSAVIKTKPTVCTEAVRLGH